MSMSQQFMSPSQLPPGGGGEEESKEPERHDDDPQDNDPDDDRAIQQDVHLLMRAAGFIGNDVNNCEEIPWGTEEGAMAANRQWHRAVIAEPRNLRELRRLQNSLKHCHTPHHVFDTILDLGNFPEDAGEHDLVALCAD